MRRARDAPMARRRLRERVWSLLAAHSDAPLVSAARDACHWATTFLHAENHDFRTNGEAWLLRCLGPATATILDVGANRGAWALAARRLCPDARIYCFEIVAETRRRLRENVAGEAGIEVLDFGLAERAGVERVKYYPERDVVSSLYDYPHPERHLWTEERVETGDGFLAGRGLAHVDLLKVDTEGADLRVLRGFAGALSRGAVAVVQFEYGYACILARSLLIDFHEFFEAKGYAVGKLHAKRVDFRRYRLQDENFFGPNFVAVHRSRAALMSRLAGG